MHGGVRGALAVTGPSAAYSIFFLPSENSAGRFFFAQVYLNIRKDSTVVISPIRNMT